MNKVENPSPGADVISRGTTGKSLNVSPATRADMSAEQKNDSCHEPHSSRHSNATAESPVERSRSLVPAILHSLGDGGTIHQLRARLIGCLKSRVNEPDWQLLLQQTERFADLEIHYGYYWRDAFGGVIPGGYDASSVAAEALAELVNEQPENGLILEPHMLRVDLKKRARKIINRLHHRMENRIMRNTPDLPPFLTDDGETISVVEKVPAPDPTPLDLLLEKEDATRFEQFKAQIRALLAHEGVLLRLFDCFCADICKPKDQARKLKLPVRHIQDLQRRLRRKLAAHGYVPSSWKSRIRATYFNSQPTCPQTLAKAA